VARVDFVNVSTIGLEASPVALALAGLRANEARYFAHKFDHSFTTKSAATSKKVVAYVAKILLEERGIVITATPLETAVCEVENFRWTHVFYDSGLAVNVLYELAGEKPKRAAGFKLSQGMDAPEELRSFKFARQKSTLAGEIRGSYFVIKGAY